MILVLAAIASAADWPILQGTEPGPDPAPVRPFGFVQALGEGIPNARPVEGLTSAGLTPYDGERASFNRVGTGDAAWGFSLRRARLGLRGAVPQTDGRVAWLIAAELGDNALTRVDPVVLTDASVSLSYVPGARVRVGQFKLPLGEEALEMNPLGAEFVNVSAPTGQLLLENPSADGAYTAGASGYRDLGVQLFDTFQLGAGELGYAAMLSNGRMGTLDADGGKDLTARVGWTPRVWGDRRSAQRDELGVYGFWQQGPRTVGPLDPTPLDPTLDRVDGASGVEVQRIRRGGGVKFQRSGWRARLEVIQASGAIEAAPPFPGAPVEVSPRGEAAGGHLFLHHERGLVGGGLRYDQLWRGYESPSRLQVFRTLTADVQLELSPRARILVDYERRWLAAPGGSADRQAIAASMGDRLSVQAGVVL